MRKQVCHMKKNYMTRKKRKQQPERKNKSYLVQFGKWCVERLLIPLLSSFLAQWLKGDIEHWMK